MKLYLVEIKTRAIIAAEDETDAQEEAQHLSIEIMSDDLDPEIKVIQEVTTPEQVKTAGWDLDSYPYGDVDCNIQDMVTKS